MLSWPPAVGRWAAYLSRGGIAVVLLPVGGPIGAARDASRRLCDELLEKLPRHHASRSATAGMAAVALSKSIRIGVDVERIDPDSSLDPGLLATALHPYELAAMQPLDAGRFLRLWTCKESALKAAGTGLALPAASVHVGWSTGGWTDVDFGGRASPVSARSLASPPGFAAAIATLGAPRDVRIVTHFTIA